MRYIADLHIHSKYSRACSSQIDINSLDKWARIKGVNVLGTGDFTHPEWIKELKNHLVEDGTGILKTTTGFPFVLQTEISLIYTQAGKGHRVHLIVMAPNFEIVNQITEYLQKNGRIDYDGRPIFKIPAHDFVYEMRKISYDIEVIPAHIWTPWFSLFGSNSGFDSIHECFKDQEKYIHSIETGLSSNPKMNWRLKQLDNINIVSFSDAHSFWPWRMGREATILEMKELSYQKLLRALRAGDGLAGTIEVDPGYGKYHYDGHRNCNIIMNPKEALKNNNICPVCKRKLTLGVAHRVEELADREEGYQRPDAKPFYELLPLTEVLSTMMNKTLSAKIVWKEYNKLLKRFGSEYNVLLDAPEEKINEEIHPKIAEAIINNRMGKLIVKPGYDGVYGELQIDEVDEKEVFAEENKLERTQKGLKEFF
ncbi:MAG: endonuclease Q family protein [Nanoarchaeota archaeon]|nr:endonuclease Q family protein [Nanoarchaeota archaeon]MBU1854208.1 endonuclease Q family protein [Nanoarchaeota archaeon]